MIFVWYKNLDRSFLHFVTIHAFGRRTERQTEFSLLDHVCIACCVVKTDATSSWAVMQSLHCRVGWNISGRWDSGWNVVSARKLEALIFLYDIENGMTALWTHQLSSMLKYPKVILVIQARWTNKSLLNRSKIGDFASMRSLWPKTSGRRGRPPPIIFAWIVRPMNTLQLCCWQFSQKETM